MRLGVNANEVLLTGHGPQHFYCNQFRSARSYRLLNGATVDRFGYPESTEAGNPLSRISYTMSHFSGGLPEPYHGSFTLLCDGEGEITIKRKDKHGATIDTLFRQTVSGHEQLPVIIPPCDVDSAIHVTFRHVTKHFPQLALAHVDHLDTWQQGIEFNPDYLGMLKRVGGVWRTMKLTRTDDDPEGVTIASVRDLDWTGKHPNTRRGVPYLDILQAAKHAGIAPWIALNASISDADIDTLAHNILHVGIPLYLEYGNEVFHGPRGGSPHHYWIAQAQAKWPGCKASAASGRQWLVWRWSQILDRLEAAGVRHLVRAVYADQGNWPGWVAHAFDVPLWANTAALDGEADRFTRWSSGAMVDVFAFNAYYGERLLPKMDGAGAVKKPGFISMAEKDDPAKVLDGLSKGIRLRSGQIASVKMALKTRLPGKQFEWAAYEGGISDSRGLIASFQSLPEMADAHAYWLDQCETTAGLDLVMHYADLSRGSWRLFPHVRAALNSTPKGKPLFGFLGRAAGHPAQPQPVPAHPPIPPGPVTPPVDDHALPVDDPQPPLPPVDDTQKPPVRDTAAIADDMQALVDELRARG